MGLITSLGSLVIGVLLGAWVTYRFSLILSRQAEKHRAGLRLRDAFKTEIIALNPSHHAIDEDLPVFLGKAFDKHEAAIYDFSFFLSAKSKNRFYKTWQEYYCHENTQNENTVPFLEQYSCRGRSIKEIHDIKNLVKSRLEAVLKFAEKT